jgi:hypothetical protein
VATGALKHPNSKNIRVRAYTTFLPALADTALSSFYARTVRERCCPRAMSRFQPRPVDFAIRLGDGIWPGAIVEQLIRISSPLCSPALLARDRR